jgi:phosphatidylserine/phosphatidylglycerophosphate/cardiolipin synthase-like enzyme
LKKQTTFPFQLHQTFFNEVNMKIPMIGIVLGLFAASSSMAETAKINFDLMSTVQDCSHEGHRSTWCTIDDLKASTEKSGIVQRLVEQFDRALAQPSKSKVLAAEFSFSNKLVQTKLCELGKAGVSIQVYLDHGSPAGDISECQKNTNNPNYKIDFLGGFTNFPEWRLHHNKTILVDAGDGSPYDIDFASGNLSSYGTSLHLENWVAMQAEQTTNIARATLCLFEGLAVAKEKSDATQIYNNMDFSKDPAVMSAYQQAINNCYEAKDVIPMYQTERALKAEGIAPIFVPNSGNLATAAFLKEIKEISKIGKGAYIYIAIEHFTKGSIARALSQAADNGVDVRIIMNAGTVTGATEVQSDVTFYDQNIRGTNISARFIETNPDAGGNGQQMHNKFTILNGKRVFSGAGHYTSSGLETNYETLYFTQDEKLNRQYAEYFKKLWDASVDESSMRSGDVNNATSPQKLSESLLKLIESK